MVHLTLQILPLNGPKKSFLTQNLIGGFMNSILSMIKRKPNVCLHPNLYQNHGSAIGYWKGSVDLNGYVTIEYAKKLDGKPVQKHYQAFAKNVGRANATTPYEQGASEVASKARLKMDKGYVETVEEATEPSTNSLGLLNPCWPRPWRKSNQKRLTGLMPLFNQAGRSQGTV